MGSRDRKERMYSRTRGVGGATATGAVIVRYGCAKEKVDHAVYLARLDGVEMACKQLREGGYKFRHIHQLKGRHVRYLIDRWVDEGACREVIEARLDVLRWLAAEIEKNGMVEPLAKYLPGQQQMPLHPICVSDHVDARQ